MGVWYKRGALYHVLRYDPDFALKQEEEEVMRPAEEVNKLLTNTYGCDIQLRDVASQIGNTKTYIFMGRKYKIWNCDDRMSLYHDICWANGFVPTKIMTAKQYADYLRERKIKNETRTNMGID